MAPCQRTRATVDTKTWKSYSMTYHDILMDQRDEIIFNQSRIFTARSFSSPCPISSPCFSSLTTNYSEPSIPSRVITNGSMISGYRIKKHQK